MDAFAQHERARLKAVLDATSDFAIAGSRVTFAQHFETVCAKEPFCVMPEILVESCRRLLDADVCNTISTIVRQRVFVTIGCNTFPLFALESGGVVRILFMFHNVYTNCTSFLDVRLFASAVRIKLVVVFLSQVTLSTRSQWSSEKHVPARCVATDRTDGGGEADVRRE